MLNKSQLLKAGKYHIDHDHLERARRNLAGLPEVMPGIDLTQFQADARQVEDKLRRPGLKGIIWDWSPFPALPLSAD